MPVKKYRVASNRSKESAGTADIDEDIVAASDAVDYWDRLFPDELIPEDILVDLIVEDKRRAWPPLSLMDLRNEWEARGEDLNDHLHI